MTVQERVTYCPFCWEIVDGRCDCKVTTEFIELLKDIVGVNVPFYTRDLTRNKNSRLQNLVRRAALGNTDSGRSVTLGRFLLKLYPTVIMAGKTGGVARWVILEEGS